MTQDNTDLRAAAKTAIASYMHHELFEITGDTKMLPWLETQGEAFLDMIDRGIAHVKKSPLADEVKKLRG
jgi:hypothetical protein